MRAALPFVLGAWIFAVSAAFAQSPSLPSGPVPYVMPEGKGPAPAPATMPPLAPPADVVVMPVDQALQPDAYRFWMRVDYLAYWVKNTPMAVPLVTGDPNSPTQPLLGSDQSFGMFSGVRVGLGFWVDPGNTLGFDANVFGLQRRTRTLFASSDSTGNPALAFDFVNQTPGAVGNFFMPITSPGMFAGDVQVASSLQLWGTDVNGAILLAGSGNLQWTALAGFRYLDLLERLNISTLSADIMTTPNTVLFQSDQFNTRNQFYGGQLGTRVVWQGARFALDVTGKVALGNTHQVIDINGFSQQTGPGGVNGVFPGGFFTQPSNMGRFSSNQFGVIPAVELKLHYFVNQWIRAYIGYDFLYWNQVVRPGNQIDHNINLSQSAVLGTGALSGPASPAPLLNRTDFWVQGATIGLEFRY